MQICFCDWLMTLKSKFKCSMYTWSQNSKLSAQAWSWISGTGSQFSKRNTHPNIPDEQKQRNAVELASTPGDAKLQKKRRQRCYRGTKPKNLWGLAKLFFKQWEKGNKRGIFASFGHLCQPNSTSTCGLRAAGPKLFSFNLNFEKNAKNTIVSTVADDKWWRDREDHQTVERLHQRMLRWCWQLWNRLWVHKQRGKFPKGSLS